MKKSANEFHKKIRKSDPEFNLASLVSYPSQRQHPLTYHGVSPDWDVSPMEDFEAYLPSVQSSSSGYVMELLAQLRPSGRILDHFRITLDGSAAISRDSTWAS